MTEPSPKPVPRGRWVLRAMQIACVVLVVACVLGPTVPRLEMRLRRKTRVYCVLIREALDQAKALLAIEQKLAPGTNIHESALTNYLKDQRLPKCPQGGKYTVNPIGVPVSCSLHGAAAEGSPAPSPRLSE